MAESIDDVRLLHRMGARGAVRLAKQSWTKPRSHRTPVRFRPCTATNGTMAMCVYVRAWGGLGQKRCASRHCAGGKRPGLTGPRCDVSGLYLSRPCRESLGVQIHTCTPVVSFECSCKRQHIFEYALYMYALQKKSWLWGPWTLETALPSARALVVLSVLPG